MFKFFWDLAILGVRCFVMCRAGPMSARLPSQSGKVNMCAASTSAQETSKRRSVGIGWIAWVNGQTNGFGAGQKVQIETPGGGAPPPSRQQGSEPDHPERAYQHFIEDKDMKLSDSRQTCFDSARSWQILGFLLTFHLDQHGRDRWREYWRDVFEPTCSRTCKSNLGPTPRGYGSLAIRGRRAVTRHDLGTIWREYWRDVFEATCQKNQRTFRKIAPRPSQSEPRGL